MDPRLLFLFPIFIIVMPLLGCVYKWKSRRGLDSEIGNHGQLGFRDILGNMLTVSRQHPLVSRHAALWAVLKIYDFSYRKWLFIYRKLIISDTSEEQLARVFAEAGPVQGVE
jgi:hypothetical protein